MNTKFFAAVWAVALTGLVPCAAWAQVTVVDDFTQNKAAVSWKSFNGACLTAGDGSGSIPACVGLPYYTEPLVGGATGVLPDPIGQGALRFTNGSINGNTGGLPPKWRHRAEPIERVPLQCRRSGDVYHRDLSGQLGRSRW